METIIKIDETKLEITNTEETKVILPKIDIEARIANLEEDLIKAKELLDYFK